MAKFTDAEPNALPHHFTATEADPTERPTPEAEQKEVHFLRLALEDLRREVERAHKQARATRQAASTMADTRYVLGLLDALGDDNLNHAETVICTALRVVCSMLMADSARTEIDGIFN
jgi:hypothetical protein